MISIGFVTLDDRAICPTNAHGTDAGWDLHVLEDTLVQPWTAPKPVSDVRSGIALDIPEGWYVRIVGRSSSIRKKRMQVIEGVIDAGYQGELFATVASASDRPELLAGGSSLAQLIVCQVEPVRFLRRVSFEQQTFRGADGFGSSGR